MDREEGQQMDRSLMTRRDALRAGAVGVGALAMAGRVGTAAAAGSSNSPVTINMLTWNDHYDPKKQLPAVAKQTGITVHPTLGSDDGTMFIKAKESHEEFAIVSADALWVPYYHPAEAGGAVRHQVVPGVEAALFRRHSTCRSGRRQAADTWRTRGPGRRFGSITTRSSSTRRPRRGRCCWTRSTRASSSGRTSRRTSWRRPAWRPAPRIRTT